jgi:hypothetical protein
MQPSSCITNTPAAGSGAGADQFPHWPHPGGWVSSLSEISTAATWLPPAGAGVGEIIGAVVAIVVTTAAAAASPCGSAATATLRESSPVVATLPAVRDALDERCLVGKDASDLSTLAGASARTVSAILRTRKQRTERQPLETGASGGATAYLNVEKPCFLFLEGSADAAVAPIAATAALPDASEAHVGASAVHAAPSTDRPVAGASVPTTGASSSAVSAALCDGGGGIHLSGGACPPSLSSSSSDDEVFSGVAGGESPCCSRSRYSSLYCSRRFRR